MSVEIVCGKVGDVLVQRQEFWDLEATEREARMGKALFHLGIAANDATHMGNSFTLCAIVVAPSNLKQALCCALDLSSMAKRYDQKDRMAGTDFHIRLLDHVSKASEALMISPELWLCVTLA